MAAPLDLAATAPGLAFDTRSLGTLKARAATDPRGAAREAARQFESLFMNELLKSMRAATMSSDLLDNAGTELGTQMLDTQLATQLAGMRGGLSDAIQRHLERQMGLAPGPIPAPPAAASAPAGPPALQPSPVRIPQRSALGFIEQHTEAARAAERETGIPAAFMVAQAAHESGWGRREIRHADGSPAFNLFGIKAGPNWKGPVAEVLTTEYEDGRARKVVQRFRAYASHAESFADYARLMKNSPRYEAVVAKAQTAEGFAQGLQRAGYATDPAYADKLTRVINTTLRLKRELA